MNRRTVLRLFATSGIGTLLSLGATSLHSAIAQSKPNWGYVGAKGPENWGNLSSEYSACSNGLRQSPIDLHGAYEAQLPNIKINYNPVPLQIVNTGSTIQLNTVPGNYITLDGEKYELLQLHFHHPSEHTVKGQAYPMEAHFVHRNAKGELAVLAAFLKEGAENKALVPIWNAMPDDKSSEKSISGLKVNIAQILPAKHSSFRYFGSLTTPPCSETVRWIIFEQPVEASNTQIQKFSQIFPLNARPVQPLNERFLLESN